MKKLTAIFFCVFMLLAMSTADALAYDLQEGEELVRLKVDATLIMRGALAVDDDIFTARDSFEYSYSQSSTYTFIREFRYPDKTYPYGPMEPLHSETRHHGILVSASGNGKEVWADGFGELTWTTVPSAGEYNSRVGVQNLYFDEKSGGYAGSLYVIEDMYYDYTNISKSGIMKENEGPGFTAASIVGEAIYDYARRNQGRLWLPLNFNGGNTAFGTVAHSYRTSGADLQKGDASFTWSFRATLEAPPDDFDLKAVPKVASSIQRGETLNLDGTASTVSKGKIEEYIWTLTPTSGDAKITTKRGEKQELLVLDDLNVTLTVTSGGRFDSETVSVKVVPRPEFKTKYGERPGEGLLAGDAFEDVIVPQTRGGASLRWLNGENVCAIDPPQYVSDAVHFLHPNVYRADPHRRAEVDKTTLFTLEQVEDPGNPWHEYFYFTEWKMKMDRRILINPHILPNAGPIDGFGANFYQLNKYQEDSDVDIDAYLENVRKHEHTHSTLAFQALEKDDPGLKIEALWGTDRTKLEDDAFELIVNAERAIFNNAKDPLPDPIWEGNLFLPDLTTGDFYRTESPVTILGKK